VRGVQRLIFPYIYSHLLFNVSAFFKL
jgi:hypothetical protein